MKNLYLLAALCLAAASPVCAQTPSAAPPTYNLRRMQVSDAVPAFYVWEVRSAPENKAAAPPPPENVFRSLDAPEMRAWTAHLPARSVIRFYSIAMPVLHVNPNLRPDTTFWAQLKSFGEFCEKHKVLFRPELHSF